MYTTDDLIKVAKQQAKNGVTNYRDYKTYLGKFTSILKYLIKNDHISKEEDAALLFLSAFSNESQRSIKRTLVNKGQLPKAKDGSNKAPKWDDLVAAAETEIRINKGYVNFSSFSESNQAMQKNLEARKGDGKRREQMLQETPNDKAVEQKLNEVQQELASLKQQLKNTAPVYRKGPVERQEFSREAPRPSTPLYESTICYYCKREGHSTGQCPEFIKDKSQGLVKREGKEWYLPNGQHIPWNPSRPIRSVVASASADPAMQDAIRNLAESRQNNGSTPMMQSSAQTVEWEPPQLGAENYLRTHAITRSEAQKGRRS
ncbi:hypothetical protein PTTG_30776, partial [Puccinia triticina 1-1 BBBD Race 1]